MDRVSLALASHLHSVFDTDPEPALALRVRHALGAAWSVYGDVLTLTTPGGTWQWPTDTYTIGTLADAIAAAGFDVVYTNPDLEHLNASILLDGEGQQDASNGDHITALTAPLTVLLSALGLGLGDGKEAIADALAQLILPQSTAEWADLFGSICGVLRWVGEEDDDYTARIIEEVKRNRSNPAAILRNIRRLTGEDLVLREPWKEIHTLSVSLLSGPHHLQGAPIYEYHRMQLVATRGPDWSRVLPEANADRPAGTLMLPPATHPPVFLVDGMMDQFIPNMARIDARGENLFWNAYGRLSVDLSLSNYIPPPPFEFARVDVLGLGDRGLRGPYEDFGDSGLGWYGTWSEVAWSSAVVSSHEIYPPHDIYASHYHGIFRVSGSGLSTVDRLQYDTDVWQFAWTGHSVEGMADDTEVDAGRRDAHAEQLFFNVFGQLSVMALSDYDPPPIFGFKQTGYTE